jgi:translation initiation factor IF-2
LQKEKVRIYALARELDMESKDLLDLCRQNGIDVRNQLSSVEPEQRDQIVALVKRGGGVATAAPPKGPAALTPPPTPIRNLPPSKPPVLKSGPPKREPEPTPPPTAPAAQKPAAPPTAPPPAAPAAQKPTAPPPAKAPETPAPPAPEQPAAARPAEPVSPSRPPQAPAAQAPPAEPGRPQPAPGAPRPLTGGPVRDLNQPRGDTGPRRTGRDRTPRLGTFRMAQPPTLKQQRPPEAQKPAQPQQPAGPKKIGEIPAALLGQGTPVKIEDILRHQQQTPGKPGVSVPVEDEEDDDKKKGGHKRPGGVVGRDARHKERNERQQRRKAQGEELRAGRITALLEDDTPAGRQARRDRIRAKMKKQGTQPRKGKVPIEHPITVRSLSEALGINKGDLLFKLMGHGAPPTININSLLDTDMAETIALEQGCELEIKRQLGPEDQLLAAAKAPSAPEDLVPRAPIVAVMGHVDHGKTSLLDRIRQNYGIKSDVVSTEAGGITQVIRAWRVEKDGKPITFLDTPGHEAFTKMRARGANVTDIAVIVVAADDGVMPQTEEAISHAKAAGVSVVVAINKVDLPSANVRKTEQQLYGLGLIPDNMGGDVPFVQTSAAKGTGIDELLENLSVVAELKELKANPKKSAVGTCLEANLNEKEGVQAVLLVQDGTLHRGDVVLCGATYGRVRQMYDDMGRPVEEAGPSVPVRITGLDEVPNADDPFLAVPELSTAHEIAAERKARQQEAALVRRGPVTLENLTEAKIAELKVILKADARGSIEAIRKELEKLHHEEVRVKILHAAIGGITVSDVNLALTSPQDTLIVGFNAVPDDAARALAEERGVQVRQYNIIYNLTDDIRSALEGKLKPREEIIHLGRAVVRETFKISRVGTIAGCYVTQGVIERSAKVRVIRSGVVVYPPADRAVGLESLKRFKEDVREVREGFECGLKVAGYDDVKMDDVIEAYRVEQVQRTLS